MTTAPATLTEESDPFCLPESKAMALLRNAPWHRFAVLGDSLSAGTGDPSPHYANLGWSDRVANTLQQVNPELAYLNTAKIGATTSQALEQQLDQILAFTPDLLYLPCGANDIVRRQPDYQLIEQPLRQLYSTAAATEAQLLTFTLSKSYLVPTFPDWSERVRILNNIIRTLAAEYGVLLIDMWDHPITQRANLLSADRIHFSTSGQAVLAAEVVKKLAKLIRNDPDSD